MTKEQIIEKINETIADLVYNKTELLKAYNYYNGKRDPELYRYLEENFGIGNPTSVKFTPLLRKHIDALVGEYLGVPILPKVSCKDIDTISNMEREKQLKIKTGLVSYLKLHLNNFIIKLQNGKSDIDTSIQAQLDKILLNLDQSFMSEYEIAAQNVIQYIMQSRDTDMVTKLRLLLTDLLITGYTFFRVKPTASGENVKIEVLNPLNTFIDRNPESPYVKDSYRCVVRQWMTKGLILAKYGNLLDKEDIDLLRSELEDPMDGTATYRRTYSNVISAYDIHDTDGDILPGYPGNEYGASKFHLLPVYEVEWLETDEKNVMHRYEGVRIGESIYIPVGKSKHVIRSSSEPNVCHLTVNGVYLLNRAQQPYSLILECAHLQDLFDLVIYYRDNLIATSGTKGLIIDVSMIPAFLGDDLTERMLKLDAYRKQGKFLIDSSLEGRNDNGNAPNLVYNGFDDTLSGQIIQAFEIVIQSIESTLSSITGVFRERLNGIEQRDAVTNIKLGVLNSFTITKPYYLQMDLITREILLDSLNLAKSVYKKGLTGTIILGDNQQKTFTALPEHFTLTDFDIHIIASTLVMEEMLQVKQLIPDFIKSGLVAPDLIFEAMTSKSLSDLKYKVLKALQVQKEENNQIQLLSLKLQETEQLMQQMLQLLQQALAQVESLNRLNMLLEQHKINLEYKVDWFKATKDDENTKEKLSIERDLAKVLILQLQDGNPYNDKIRDIQ